MRQWVLPVPKRLLDFMQRDGVVRNMVLQVIAQTLQPNSPVVQNSARSAWHIAAAAFTQRFGSSLNEHLHFHVCVVDGVFEDVAGVLEAADAASSTGVIFQPATVVNADSVTQVQATLRWRSLRAIVGRGPLDGFEAKEMRACRLSGFSVDASVCIKAHDHPGLERLLHYRARPPFASG